MNLHQRLILALVLGASMAVPLRAAPKELEYTDEQFKADEKLVFEVAGVLLNTMKPVKGCNWPPDVKFIKDEDSPMNLRGNAWATFTGISKEDIDRGVALSPIVRITTGWMKDKVKGNKHALAWVLSHELGHIQYKHPLADPGKTDFIATANSRSHELEADAFGAKLMLEAGFSMRKAMESSHLLLSGQHGGSIGNLVSTHPDWRERFEKFSGDPQYWRSMSAFTNGVVLLNAEQYVAATECFDRVLEEFPKCYEALVNRGYAFLMLYFDEFKPEDLKAYDVGQIMCGGFYRRAKSLEPPVRGGDKLWKQAFDSFREALKLKPDLALAKANLGLAYLFHPDGKQTDKAAEYLQEAVDALDADKTMDPLTRAATYVNLGAAQIANGNRTSGLQMFDKAVAIVEQGKKKDQIDGMQVSLVQSTAMYHRAQDLAGKDNADERKQAADLLEKYLLSNDPLSAWWPRAYDRYVEVCTAIKIAPRTKESILKVAETQLRVPTGLILEGGLKINLTDQMEDVLKRLGPAKITPLLGSALKRYRFEKFGIDLLGSDQVIAIILTSPKGPGIKLQARGVRGDEVVELKVGVDRTELQKKMPGFGSFVSRELLAPDVFYHYYRQLGIAIRYDTHPTGKISELLLVRIPEPKP